MMLKYSVNIIWSDEDNGFIATIPELPGVSAFGETQKEAVSEIQIAAQAYLASLRDSGKKLPPPEKLVPYSGQLRLRMPKGLHGRLAAWAKKEGISLNTYLLHLLSQNHSRRETIAELADIVNQRNFKLKQSRPIDQKMIHE